MILSIIILLFAYNHYSNEKRSLDNSNETPTKVYIRLAWVFFCIELIIIFLLHRYNPMAIAFPIIYYLYRLVKPQKNILLTGIYTGKSNNISTGGGL
jgi:hypothetical protein